MDFGTWGAPLGTLAAAGLSQLVAWQVQNHRDSRLKRSLEALKLLEELRLPAEAWRVKVYREAADLLLHESRRAFMTIRMTVFMVIFFLLAALISINSSTSPMVGKIAAVFVCSVCILWFIRDAARSRQITKNSSTLKAGLRATYMEELEVMHGEYLPLVGRADAKTDQRANSTNAAVSPARVDVGPPSEASRTDFGDS